MSRFRINHPSRSDTYSEAGVDHALGFFVSVHREGRGRPIKELDFFTRSKPVTLSDVFELLIQHEFFTREQLHDALVWLQDGGREPSSDVMRVVEIIERFKSGS